MRYFPPNIVLRARYLYDAGVFQWWQKHMEYSQLLKTSIHANNLIPKTYNRKSTSESDGSKTAVLILALIHSVGLFVSCIVFACFELNFIRAQLKKGFAHFNNCLNVVLNLFINIGTFVLKPHTNEVQNIILINVQPKI